MQRHLLRRYLNHTQGGQMLLFIDAIHDFYDDAQNRKEFEEWKERKSHNANEYIQKASPNEATHEEVKPH